MALDDLDLKRIDFRFAYYALITRGFDDAITGTAQPQITRDSLRRIHLPLPPLAEQRRIADRLDKADAIRRKRKEAIAFTEELLRSAFLEMFGDPVINTKGWPVKQLSDVVQEGTIVTYGIVQAGPHVDGGIPYIRTGDIKDSCIVIDGLLRTSPEIAARFKRSEVRAGELVMSIRATVGTVAIVPPSLDGANLTQGTARIAPGEDVTREYLFEHIRAPGMQRWLQEQVKGATFKEITLGALRTAPIMLPPRTLQQQFSAMSARIERARERQGHAGQNADMLFKALLHSSFRSGIANSREAC
jgi:type I restriction enzyme S subunit